MHSEESPIAAQEAQGVAPDNIENAESVESVENIESVDNNVSVENSQTEGNNNETSPDCPVTQVEDEDVREENDDLETFSSKVNPLYAQMPHVRDDGIENPDFIRDVSNQDVESGLETSFKRKVPIQLEWRNLQFEVAMGPPIPYFPRDKKVILHTQSGYVKPGEILAIMGPSGAGKTTILNCLSQRELNYTGTVKVNGRKLPSSFPNFSAYVEQDDVLHANLTVYQVLRYAAYLRLPTFMSHKQRMARVNEVMQILGLDRCKDTKVGSPGGEKGISGGERKRLSIALEILKGPPLLFLDEPTTGMDSKTSLNIIQALRNLARSGTTIVMTIHQPRSQVFDYFDKLLLLAEGKVCYMGEADKVGDYFAEVNPSYALQPGTNIADHVIDLITKVSNTDSINNTKELKKIEDDRLKQITNHWQDKHALTPKHIPAIEATKDLSKFPRYSSSIFIQFFVLLIRNLNNILLDKMMTTGKLFQTLVFILFLGSLYFRMENTQSAISDRLGLLFFVMLSQTMNTLFLVLQSFPSELKVFKRENASRAYSVFAYYFAKVCAEIPHQIFFPLLFGCCIYWTVGFHETAGRFFTFLLTVLLVCLTGVSLGEVISVFAPSGEIALLIGPILIVVLVFFSGFYISVANIPPYYIWIYYISLFAYGFESLLINEFKDMKFRCEPHELLPGGICPVTNGTQVINKIGMSTEFYKLWINIGALFLLMLLLKLIGFLGLLARTSRVQGRISRFFKDLKQNRLEKEEESDDEEEEPINLYDTPSKQVEQVVE